MWGWRGLRKMSDCQHFDIRPARKNGQDENFVIDNKTDTIDLWFKGIQLILQQQKYVATDKALWYMISSASLLNSKCKRKRNQFMADFALCWVTLCRYLFSVTPTPFCELGNVCRRSGDVNFALCWHQPGQLIWTNTSLSGNDTKVIALFLQIASVFSCTVGRRPPWLLTKVVIDLDFTKFVWTRDYNKSSKIWQRSILDLTH